ncbi:hypothetical protein NLO98_07730 [Pseudomonas syringae]|nr:hypothetical protein [Pseudomonas syringae]
MDTQPQKAPERIAPEIILVKDSKGVTVPKGSTTSDTVLTLTGIATRNTIVFIFDNGAILTPASVTLEDEWEFTETLVLGQHSFTVRETLGGVDSEAWVVTVAEAALVPVITSIEDSEGNPIAVGGSTTDTRVTVFGTAQANERVEIDDGTDSWGTALATGGVWSKGLNGLEARSYSITATAQYGSFSVSSAWPFSVVVPAAVPTIASIRDAEGNEIVSGGGTASAIVTLRGTASANQQVDILDGAASIGTVDVDANENWSLQILTLSVGDHSYTAKGRYGSEPVSSPPWALTRLRVVTGVEEFGQFPGAYHRLYSTTWYASGLIMTLLRGSSLYESSDALSDFSDLNSELDVSFTLSGLARRIELAMRNPYSSSPSAAFTYYDENRILISTEIIPVGVSVIVSLVAPPGRFFKYFNWTRGVTRQGGIIYSVKWFAE